MATKNYMINDKWLDLDKQNIVELQSVDGVLDSLKVNGSEIETPSGKITITENGTDIDVAQYALADVNVEGGGGSSDFSTAEVTLNLTVENATLVETSLETLIINYPSEDFSYIANHIPSINNKCPVLLYQGYATAEGVLAVDNNEIEYSSIVGTPVTTGGVSWDADLHGFEITGDGTITATLTVE